MAMNVPGYAAFFAVGGMLVLIGLVLLLAVPAPGALVLILGLVHVVVGLVMRGRARRRTTAGA
jgi:hypothetical protein